MLLDSGERRQFDSGAVRDIQEGKGREDLLPLKQVSLFLEDEILYAISENKIIAALGLFCNKIGWSKEKCILEVAKHYEEGAKKYVERNWEKGIPTHCFIDSGIRHYLKWRDGWDDENHPAAFVWNMLGYLWTVENRPECDDFPNGDKHV